MTHRPKDIAAEIEAILHPRSIAVVGASANPDTPGYDYVISLQKFGYSGRIYPVNPRAEEILGLPAFPSLRDVPGEVDYVICCIPASAVLELVDVPPPGDDQEVEFTRRWVAHLEALIRLHPEQYFWFHRRWKTRPAGTTAPEGR